jgi:hypothetical protein
MSRTEDDRLKQELGASRRTREIEDRPVTENRVVSEDDRLEMFRAQLFNDALPDLPDVPGYEPVKPEEIPGMQYASVKTGEWAGFIGVNEMLAFKLPMSLYQRYMKEAHHDAPLREENKLAETAQMIKEQLKSMGSTIEEGDGMSDLREVAPRLKAFS